MRSNFNQFDAAVGKILRRCFEFGQFAYNLNLLSILSLYSFSKALTAGN